MRLSIGVLHTRSLLLSRTPAQYLQFAQFQTYSEKSFASSAFRQGTNMAEQDPVPLTAAPAADQLVQHDGKTYRTIREGQAYILVPPKARTELDPRIAKEATESQKVFYNPIQQFNRDLSVLAIRTFGRDICERRRIKREGEKQKSDKKKEYKNKRKTAEDGAKSNGDQAKEGADQEADAASLKRSREEDGSGNAPSKLVKGTDGTKIPATSAEATQEDANGSAAKTDKMEVDGETVASKSVPDAGDHAPDNEVAQPKDETKPWQPRFRILDALSATGLRALRYAQEIPFATSIVANDMDRKAVESMGLNIKHNRLEHKITPNTGNAIAHMYHVAFPPEDSHGPEHVSAKYDVIDLDPYGTAAPFVDAALHAVNDGGMLCVTCTDSGVFASCGYPEKTFSLYGGMPIKGGHSHEGGLRLILHSIASAAAKQGVAIEPLLSLSIDFYIRVFVRVRKSPAEVKFLAGKTMVAYNCDNGCGAWTTQLLGRNTKQASSKGDNTFWKYSIAQAPGANSKCDHCGSKTHVAGPMWGGPLHNAAFIERMLKDLSEADKEVYATTDRIEGMLDTAYDEIYVSNYVPEKGPTHEDLIPRTVPEQVDESPFFVIPSALSKVIHAQAPSEAAFKGALRHAGYRATRSHCKPGSIKTEAPWTAIWEIMREWVRQKSPIKEGKVKENMPGWKILQATREPEKDTEETAESPEIVTEHAVDEPAAAANKETGDVKEMKVVFDEVLGKDRKGKRLVRYQQNPRENWGPMARAK
jgi:tRNA (guanine26-N2/guanine27-N2)-dimethyltransferase